MRIGFIVPYDHRRRIIGLYDVSDGESRSGYPEHVVVPDDCNMVCGKRLLVHDDGKIELIDEVVNLPADRVSTLEAENADLKARLSITEEAVLELAAIIGGA